MVAEHLVDRNIPDNRESNAMRHESHFYIADYHEGVIRRWSLELGVAYRGPQVEILNDPKQVPEPVALRFYNQPL